MFLKNKALLITPLLLTCCHQAQVNKDSGELPNILIAMGDDISFPHMGAYGTKWVKTPGFDLVSKNGILFNKAYTPNAKSSPSRACFLTGRNSWQLEDACNHIPFFPAKFKSFMESMNENGYFTGYTAKGWAPGVALDSSGKKRNLTGAAYNSRKLIPPARGISEIDYAANFEDFLDARSDKRPFCFWYGSNEPHRDYEYGSGVSKGGKSISEIDHIFDFWPENDTIKNDILDYAFEIEHFDNHLVRMLEILKKRGELDNTIIIVTADNGMPFPRIKGQAYEYSNHMPMAIMWGKGIRNPGRIIDDYISFIDIAPTILEVAAIDQTESGMQPIEGKSIVKIFKSSKKGISDKSRDHVLIGKERHDVGRPNDVGYPIRGIVKNGFLYIRNFKTDRWPVCNPETGYLNCDGSPTKTLILNLRRSGRNTEFWKLNFGKRVDEEMYDIIKDPECIHNLVSEVSLASIKSKLRLQLEKELTNQSDPRILGNGDVFDKYPYAQKATVDFYNRYMKGEIPWSNAGWVDSTDFERSGF